MRIVNEKYTVTWVDYEEELDPFNSNLDIHVEFKDGARYVATFFTLKNIESLFQKNRRTGECSDGTYFWAADMIIVQEMTEENILRTVQQLIEDQEFERAFDGPY